MKSNKILSIVLSVAIMLSTMTIGVFAATTENWIDSANTAWYGDGSATEYVVDTAAELAGLAKLVNEGTDSFANKTVKLGANIDLAGKEWTPIGIYPNVFKGVFEGNSSTEIYAIKNLYIELPDEKYIGLFGYTIAPAFRNFAIENADISAKSFVGSVVGFMERGVEINNVDIKGIIKIDSKTSDVATVAGYIYGNVVNCDVKAEAGSYVRMSERASFIGGLVGYMGEGGYKIANCSIEGLSIEGMLHVGELVGCAQYGNIYENNTIKKSTISASSSGVAIVSGWCYGNESAPTTFDNIATEDVVVMEKGVVVDEPLMTANQSTVVLAPAKIGTQVYKSLQAAVDAAVDGDEIILIYDAIDSKGTKIDKDVTINLNGKTYTSKGSACNNRNFLIIGDANVTIKNGTIIADGETTDNTVLGATSGTGSFGSARMESTGVLYLTDITTYNYRGWGANVKACSGKTICTNVDIYAEYGGGFEAAGGEVELYDCNVDQKGTYIAPYNSAAVSVSTGGKITVNGGTYTTTPIAVEDANGQGTTHGSWTLDVMNSGGTMIINDGTFSNDNYGDDSLATYARSVINVGALSGAESTIIINNGNFTSLSDNLVSFEYNGGKEEISVYGGAFSVDPEAYLADGVKINVGSDGRYYAVADSNIADEVTVEFVEGENQGEFDIYVAAVEDEDVINRLKSAALQFSLTEGFGYTLTPADNVTITEDLEKDDAYAFNYDGKGAIEDTAHAIKLASVKVEGVGAYTFSVVQNYDIAKVSATELNDNIEKTYVPADDTFILVDSANNGIAFSGEIKETTRDIKVVIEFNNSIVKVDDKDYTDMAIKLVGGADNKEIVKNICVDGTNTVVDGVVVSSAVVFEDVTVPYRYTVTVSGSGYRTASYTNVVGEGANEDDALVLKFWNNVKDDPDYIEGQLDRAEMTKNFLAGDIVKDNNINKYDLSAVVSYFGTRNAAVELNKYDLNRDGNIDSEDIAYVLVSFGE